MNAKEFEAKTGRPPEQDDLVLVNCPDAGKLGHLSCGWCKTHDKPIFECGCIANFDGA
jgi:hypothetical protein